MCPYTRRDPGRSPRRPMRPYVWRDRHDAVHMVRHHHPGVQLNLPANPRRPEPFFLHDFAVLVPAHLPTDDFPEQAILVVSAKGDEIGAGRGVIVPRQSNRLPVMLFRIVRHT